jgi:Recombinase
VIVEEEAREIRAMADRLLGGASLGEITRDLRRRGVPTVTGTAWSAAAARDILIRPSLGGVQGEQVRLPGAAYG